MWFWWCALGLIHAGFAQMNGAANSGRRVHGEQEINFIQDQPVTGGVRRPDDFTLGYRAPRLTANECLDEADFGGRSLVLATPLSASEVRRHLEQSFDRFLRCRNRCLSLAAAAALTRCVLEESARETIFEWRPCPTHRIVAALVNHEYELREPDPRHPERCLTPSRPETHTLFQTEVDRPTVVSLIVDTSSSMVRRGAFEVAQRVVERVSRVLANTPGLHRILVSSHMLDRSRQRWCSTRVGDGRCADDFDGIDGAVSAPAFVERGQQPSVLFEFAPHRAEVAPADERITPWYTGVAYAFRPDRIAQKLAEYTDQDSTERHLLAYAIHHAPMIRRGENSIVVWMADEHDASDEMFRRSLRPGHEAVADPLYTGLSLADIHAWPETRFWRDRMFGNSLIAMGPGEFNSASAHPEVTRWILDQTIARLRLRHASIKSFIPALSADLISDLRVPLNANSVWNVVATTPEMGTPPIELNDAADTAILDRIREHLPAVAGEATRFAIPNGQSFAVTGVRIDGQLLPPQLWEFSPQIESVRIYPAAIRDRSHAHTVEAIGVALASAAVQDYPPYLRAIPINSQAQRETPSLAESESRSSALARWIGRSTSRAHQRQVWRRLLALNSDYEFAYALSRIPLRHWQRILARSEDWSRDERQELKGMLLVATIMLNPAKTFVDLPSLSRMGSSELSRLVSHACLLRLIEQLHLFQGRAIRSN